MVIAKGEPWGEIVSRPRGLVVAASDAHLAELLSGDRDVALAVASGDLHRTLGSPAGTDEQVRRVSLDLLHCEFDGVEHLAVAHVVARRRWWHGPVYAVFNAQHLGTWDVAPHGHPNDARAEVIEVDASMTVRQRLQARRRLPAGTHVPHPHIRSTHRSSVEWEFSKPLDVYLDGRRHRRVRSVRVSVEADAYELHLCL
jgi:hypothetical protein